MRARVTGLRGWEPHTDSEAGALDGTGLRWMWSPGTLTWTACADTARGLRRSPWHVRATGRTPDVVPGTGKEASWLRAWSSLGLGTLRAGCCPDSGPGEAPLGPPQEWAE